MRWQDRDSVTSRDESFFPIRRTSTPRRCGACRCSRRFPWRSASPDRTACQWRRDDGRHSPAIRARCDTSGFAARRAKRRTIATARHLPHWRFLSRARATVMLDPRSSIRCFCIVWPAMSQVGRLFRHRVISVEKGTVFDHATRCANSVGLSASASIASGRRFRTSEAGRATLSEQRITRPACGTKTYAADLPMYGTCRGCTLTLPDEQITMNCDTCRIVHRSLSLRTGARPGHRRDTCELQPVMTTIPAGPYQAGRSRDLRPRPSMIHAACATRTHRPMPVRPATAMHFLADSPRRHRDVGPVARRAGHADARAGRPAPQLQANSRLLGIGLADILVPEHADAFDFLAYCGSGANRKLARASVLDILPAHYSQLPELIRSGTLRIDVVMLQVSPPDEHGRYSLGLAREYLVEALKHARAIVAEVHPDVPWTYGGPFLRDADIDLLVGSDTPFPDAAATMPGPVEQAIGQHVASLVEDGATLQTGIGAIPDAVMAALHDKRDLGVHTGSIGDGVAALCEAGVVTNARKTIDAGITVGGVIIGSARVRCFAHRNPALELRGTEYTHNPRAAPNRSLRRNQFGGGGGPVGPGQRGSCLRHVCRRGRRRRRFSAGGAEQSRRRADRGVALHRRRAQSHRDDTVWPRYGAAQRRVRDGHRIWDRRSARSVARAACRR